MTSAPFDTDRTLATTASYTLCGIELAVRTTDDVVAGLLGSRLRFVRSSSGEPAAIVFDIRGAQDDDHATPPLGRGRPVYDAPGGHLLYFEASDQLFIDYLGAVRVLCNPATGLIQMVVRQEPLGCVLAAHPFFTIPLLEVMKRRGHYPVHAACVALKEYGLLLVGASGAGKSTLALAMIRAGCDFLGDDMVFLHRRADGIGAWGFPEEVDVSDQTAAMFPELRHLAGRATLPGRDKHAVDVEEAFGVTPVPACRPHAVVVPTISGGRSVLRSMSASSALRELAPNILLTDPVASQAHLDMLAELVREVPCFSFATGTDLDEAAACLLEVLG
jgi:hypothetical protein